MFSTMFEKKLKDQIYILTNTIDRSGIEYLKGSSKNNGFMLHTKVYDLLVFNIEIVLPS